MDGRIPAAIAIFAAGIGVGFVARRPETAVPVPVQSPRRVAGVGALSVADDDCARDLSAARAQLRLCEKLSRDLDVEVHGVPMQWDARVPPELQPDVVKDRVERAIEECHVPLELVDWDCTEPPCLAHTRTSDLEWYTKLVECPAWSEAYDNGMTMSSGSIDCPGGAESMILFSPYAGEWMDADERENWGKRFQVRIDRAKETWPCGE